MRFGELEPRGITFSGEPVDVRTAGIWQPHHFCAFVESLSGGIVDGLAYDFHIIVATDHHQLRVAARNQKCKERKLGHTVVGILPYKMAQHMAVEMIHLHQRHAQPQ